MNVVVPNKGTFSIIGDIPPNSYSKVTYLQYSPTQTYTKGSIVWDTYLSTYKNASENDYEVWYICNSDGVMAKKPHENPLYWSVLTPENRTAYLDKYLDTQTVSVSNKPLKISGTAGIVDTISLLNITARKVYIKVGSDTAIEYDLLEDTEIWSGAIGDFRYRKELLAKVPLADGQTYTITLSNGDETTSSGYVALGKLIAGRVRNIGTTSFGSNINLMSMSSKIKDESGFSYYEKLKTYKNGNYEVTINNDTRGLVYRFMESIDAVDCLFFPEWSDSSLMAFGSFNDFSIVLQNELTSTYNLTVEGSI